MEMHSRQSLSEVEVRGISVLARRQSQRRSIVQTAVARILAFLKRTKMAIEAELAARQAATELASMNDHMLRDLGINRSEIQDAVRRQPEKLGTDARGSS